jgi:hypothetical protein
VIDDTAIRVALEGALAAASADLPQIFGENVTVEPPANTAHIRTKLFRGKERKVSTALTIADGFFEICVFVPFGGEPGPAEAIAKAIKDLYPIDELLTGAVRVLEREIQSGIPDETKAWWVVPVQIDWVAYDV